MPAFTLLPTGVAANSGWTGVTPAALTDATDATFANGAPAGDLTLTLSDEAAGVVSAGTVTLRHRLTPLVDVTTQWVPQPLPRLPNL